MQGGYGPPGGGYGAPPGAPPQGAPPAGGPAGYGGPPRAAMAAPAGGQYEFTPDQDQRIRSTGSKLTFAGIMQIVWGVGQLIFSWFWGFGQWFYNFPISIALIVVGALFIGVGSSFKRIAETQGNDIEHLMGAIGKLGAAALVQVIGFLLAMVAGILTTILIVFVGVLAAL